MSEKLYFEKGNQDKCYPLSHFKKAMEVDGINEMTLFEAKRYLDNVYFWCKHHSEFAEKGQCGVDWCSGYRPNNGKNGRCKHYGYLYYATDITKTIKR